MDVDRIEDFEFERQVWEVLSALALAIMRRTKVNILFNRALHFPNSESYKLVYEGSEELFREVLHSSEGGNIEFDKKVSLSEFVRDVEGRLKERCSKKYLGKFDDDIRQQLESICKKFSGEKEKWEWIYSLFKEHEHIYQHSNLGFAPEVLNSDVSMTFYNIGFIPSRTKEIILSLLEKGSVSSKDVIVYEFLQILEQYLGLEREETSSIVTIYPITPVWYKRGFIFIWHSYTVGDFDSFQNALSRISFAQTSMNYYISKLASVYTLYFDTHLLFSISPWESEKDVLEKWFPKDMFLPIEDIAHFVQGAIKSLTSEVLNIKRNMQIAHLRSAIATILARVMAHDLGSHMLANAELPKDGNREGYFDYLRNYVRARTVFIAEATTADPFWIMPLPLVSQVIYPFEKFDDTISPICKHLAQSEGVTEVSIEINHNGERISYQKESVSRGKAVREFWLCKPYDLFVAMPTGLVGVHALYCIFENVIRNGAKYGKDKKGQPLKLAIRIEDKDFKRCNDFYRVRIWDDHSCFDEEQFKTICSFSPPNCRNGVQVDAEEESWRIIDDTGRPVPGGWGIKEMRIASAWLRKEHLADALMRENEIELPLLRLIVVDEDGNEISSYPPQSLGKHYMGYEFFLLKPKEVLIIDQQLKLVTNIRNQLVMKGIDVTGEDLETVLKERIKHYALVIKLPSSATQRQRWFNKLQEKREELPSVLILVTHKVLSNQLSASIHINESEYAELQRELRSGDMPITLLKYYQRWVQAVFDPPEDFTLIIQLKPAPQEEALQHIADLWNQTAGEFGAQFSWKMIVWSQQREQLQSQGRIAACDYHKVLCYPLNVWGAGVIPDAIYFYEHCRRNQPSQIVLFNPPQDPFVRLKMALSLAEGSIANVAVVDERIWGKRDMELSEESGCPNLIQSMERRRILMPTERNVNYEDPKGDETKLADWLRKNSIKILVIHQGILDKMFDTKEDIERWIEELKKDIPFIIVESDRGEGLLPKLPRNIRFTPFSAIETWFSPTTASKFFLVQTLLSATKGG